MALNIKNRKKVEKLIFNTLSKLEIGGLNAKKYKELFEKMSDVQFLAFFKKMQTDDTAHLYVETDLYGKNQITMDSIEEAAEFLNVPLEEYLYIQHKTDDGEIIRLPQKVPVMYIHLKRMQQLLSKKNISNVDIDSGNVRSRITGGLNATNKSGRFTDSDTQALLSATSETGTFNVSPKTNEEVPAFPIMAELMHMRGDNNVIRANVLQQIAFSGEVSLLRTAEAMEGQPRSSTRGQATQTLDVYYLGAGLKTDVMHDHYLTKVGSKDKDRAKS